MADNSSGAGGFLLTGLASPAPSNASSRPSVGLPHPRAHSLRAGSVKEDKVRRFAEERLLRISRRYVKKFGLAEESDEVKGYKSMSELCSDVQEVVDILWLSGTPSLQIPYLLNIANEFTTWLGSFSPSPAATFTLLKKLDHCFASLLAGEDILTKETLPGFENGMRGGMTSTDMVRCKSLVEQTRIIIIEVMSRGDIEMSDDGDKESDTDGMGTTGENDERITSYPDDLDDDDDDDDELMDAARVYEHTLDKLGEKLDSSGPAIGINFD